MRTRQDHLRGLRLRVFIVVTILEFALFFLGLGVLACLIGAGWAR